MSKILITGNGFDLFHHLPTKYGHFMAIMMTIEGKNFSDNITFEELFGFLFKERFQNDYDSIKENYDIEKLLFDCKRVIKIKELILKNNWYHYFKTVLELETWIEFENEIEKLLYDISSIFNVLKNNPNIYNYYRKDKINVYNDLTCFGFIKENRELEVEIKSEFLNNHNRTVKEKLILKNLANSMEEFIDIFNRYLIEIVYVFYDFRVEKYSIPFDLINEIFTFNYTPTLEKLYKVIDSKVIYLHGKSNADYKSQNLVLGISEIPNEVKNHKMYDFAKYYQKIKKDSNPKFILNLDQKNKNTIEETIFYIIGHSLDESDKEYFTDLFNFLMFEIKSKICVFYHDLYDKQNKIKNLLSIVDKEIVVNLNKDKRLYFKQLTEVNLIAEFEMKLFRRGVIRVQ